MIIAKEINDFVKWLVGERFFKNRYKVIEESIRA
jgi:hypothetical protein